MAAVAGAVVGPSGGKASSAKPRLMILRMELENFKSYGGVKVIGPFHKSFSSVVGPNGSGKSNVIDAMLFVFGKRAKQMRLSKLSELIHKSAEYPDLPYVRVSVYFQDILDDPSSEDGYTVVPGTELVITRTADRSSSSKYYINGSTSTFTDVGQLLRGRGIDLDNNRFLILQGEVEQISMMKPKGTGSSSAALAAAGAAGGAAGGGGASSSGEDGLLEYLEDIIGSNQYVPKIAEAEKVVEDLSTQRGEKLARVKIVEKEKNSLEGAKMEAEALNAKDRAYLRQKGVYIQKLLSDAEDALQTADAQRKDTGGKLSSVKERLASMEGSHKELQERSKATSAEAEAASSSLRTAKETMASLEKKDVQIVEDYKQAVQDRNKQEAAAARETAAAQQCRASLASLEKSLPSLEASIAQLTEERAREEAGYEAVLDSLKGETEGLRKQMEAKQLELQPATEATAAVGAKLEAAKTELRLLKERADAAGKEAEALRAQLSKLQSDSQAKTGEGEALRKEQAAQGVRKAELEKELAAVLEKEKAANEALGRVRSKLEEGKAAQAESGGPKTGLLAELLAASKKGGPLASAGLLGRLGDLGAIEDKYDIAVTTACAALNYLVVETAESGQACVDYLRLKGLGRAKFIMLDKVGWVRERMAAAFKAPEAGTARLFDLIHPADERARLAFYFALRDTLVAQDMGQAVRVAYSPEGRPLHRVVTLAGELIDTSGTMSGGGGKPRRGGMSSKLSSRSAAMGGAAGGAGGGGLEGPEDLAAAEAELASITAALTALRSKKAALQAELKELERSGPKLATRASKLDMELQSLGKMMADLQARLTAGAGAGAGAAAGAEAAADLQRISALASEVTALAAEYGRLSARSGKLDAELAALQKAILDVGGEKVRRAKARLDRATEALEEGTKAVTKARAEQKSSSKGLEKAEKAAAAAVKEKAEAEERMRSLKAAKLALEEEAVGIQTGMVALQQRAAETEIAAKNAAAALAEADKEGKQLKASLQQLTAQLKEAEAAFAAAQKRAEAAGEKLQECKGEYAEAMRGYVQQLQADAALAGEEEEQAEKSKEAAGAAAAEEESEEEEEEEESESSSSEGEEEELELEEEGAAQERKKLQQKAKEKEKERHRKERLQRKKGKAAAAAAAEGERKQKLPSALNEPLELPAVPKSDLRSMSLQSLTAALELLKSEREGLARKVNMAAIEEYRAKERDYLRRVGELEAVSQAREAARKQWEGLRKRRLEEFMSGFSVISLRLKEMYQMITLGGDAELELVDSCDPFSEGILFQVRPPKKSWKNISNLSGGEKTLSSLALVFALHHYKPTPLYVMDEIDAALDFKNVSIVANYIKERTRDAQFIIISLRNNMFELADRLVGIYKTADVTKSVTINPKKVAEEAAKVLAKERAGEDQENTGSASSSGSSSAGAGKAAAGAGAAAVTTTGKVAGTGF